MELIGIAAVFTGLALLTALPLMALLALAEAPRHEQDRHLF
ncbi:hypothetical protein [Parasphingorhabdus pacifica]